jgi:multiple antibiotic resistance protein
MSEQMLLVVRTALVVVGALLPIVNPLGDAPIFLRFTDGCDQKTRRELAWRIALYSFLLLLGSMMLGSLVLHIFDLSIPVVQIAGGAVVCALGWRLLNAEDPKTQDVRTVDADHVLSQAFYPLTLPITIDPGAMSVAITVGANHAHTLRNVALEALAAAIGIAFISLSVLLTYRFAGRLGHWIGRRGMLVILRLSAFLVLCIGVQITWNGLKVLLHMS